MLVSAVKDTEKEKTKMTQKYFAVTVKFGHVGQHKCIIKTVPVKADSGKEAAFQARWMPRVKHHDKHAIINVKEIDLEAYLILMIEKSLDPYFQCKNIQEQRNECDGIEDEIQYMKEDDVDYEERAQRRRERINFQRKKYKTFGTYCYKSTTHLVANAY